MYMYEPPPPFIGTWEQMRSNTIGMVKKTTYNNNNKNQDIKKVYY